MKKKLFSVLSLSLLVLSGCHKKKDIQVPDPALEGLFGTWSMVQSYGDFSGRVITPESLGYTPSIAFKADGTFYQYKDGSVLFTDNFSFRRSEQAYATHGSKNIIVFEKLFNRWVYISNDSLYLDGADCNDCGSEIYIKE